MQQQDNWHRTTWMDTHNGSVHHVIGVEYHAGEATVTTWSEPIGHPNMLSWDEPGGFCWRGSREKFLDRFAEYG